MYRSPIDLNISRVIEHQAKEAAEKFDNLIFSAVYEVVPSVDKDELLRALHYDRDQYNKGFVDGKVAAMKELVFCMDCKHFTPCQEVDGDSWTGYCYCGNFHTDEEDFCSRGERREDLE